MSVKPILFSMPMVREILDGRKTMTRRLVKPQPTLETPEDPSNHSWIHWGGYVWKADKSVPHCELKCEPFKPGDILWVRETWAIVSDMADIDPELGYLDNFLYKADDWGKSEQPKWRPSIHMPREAARIFLRVTDVRMERLQDMTPEDCVHDGGFALEAVDAVGIKFLFGGLWDSLIKPFDLAQYGWDANPWVWVISFERCEKP